MTRKIIQAANMRIMLFNINASLTAVTRKGSGTLVSALAMRLK
jgi:hypothetical protein